jgi:hypothetical protein
LRIAQPIAHAVQRTYHAFEARALATKLLGTLGRAPDGGIFQLAIDLG